MIHAEADLSEARIHVAGIMEQYTTDVIADQRKPQLERIDEQGFTAHRESGKEIPRAGLILREAAM